MKFEINSPTMKLVKGKRIYKIFEHWTHFDCRIHIIYPTSFLTLDRGSSFFVVVLWIFVFGRRAYKYTYSNKPLLWNHLEQKIQCSRRKNGINIIMRKMKFLRFSWKNALAKRVQIYSGTKEKIDEKKIWEELLLPSAMIYLQLLNWRECLDVALCIRSR